jgi:tartrate/fumarate subfamily iron-sulfur-dependent hydro-lyase alpha chain
MMVKRISSTKLHDLFLHALIRAVQVLPTDVRKALDDSLAKETDEIARLHLETFIRNAELGRQKRTFVCPDTGWTIFYIKVGTGIDFEEGLSSLQTIAEEVVAELSSKGCLRPSLADPLTRSSIESNVGEGYPHVEIIPDPSNGILEVTAVPKGGGSEISGTFYRMFFPADGMNGIINFIIECFLNSSYGGKSCPPNIIGVGIGGTADKCMRMAKEAAVLIPIGERHWDPKIAKLETDLLSALNDLGVGPMGTGGNVSVLDVHIERALAHTGALPVAFNAQCSLARRATACLTPGGEINFVDNPRWRKRCHA